VTVPISRLDAADTLRPAARPVDRFVQQDTGAKRAEQVARALSSLSAPAAELANRYREAKDLKEFNEGKRYAEQNTSMFDTTQLAEGDEAEAKLVRKGVIPAGRSKAFLKGAAQVAGARAATKYNLDLKVWLDKKGEQANSPEELAQLAQQFDTEWREQNIAESDMANNEFFDKFSSAIREGQYNTLYSQTVKIENRKQEKAEADVEGMAYNLTTELAVADDNSDFAQRWDTEVTYLRETAYQMGMNGETANRLVYDGLAKAAVELGRPDIVNRALEKHSIGGTPLPPTIEANLRRASVLASNRVRTQREETYAVRREQGEKALIDLAAKFVASPDPATLDISAEIAQLASIDAGLVGAANNLRAEFIEAKRIRSATHADGDVLRAIDGNRSNAKTVLTRLRATSAITDEQYNRFMPYATNVEADTKPGSSSRLRWSVISEYAAQLRVSLKGKGWDEEDVANKVADFTVEANAELLRDPNMDTNTARKLLIDKKTLFDDRKPEPPPQASATPEGESISR
jgi:hypothetical protein